MTTGTPPTWSMSVMTNGPKGLTSARCGTFLPIRSKSSIVRSTSASWAMASRWSTALVEPPKAMTTAMAFSNASFVMMSRPRDTLAQQLDHGLTRTCGRSRRGGGRSRAARPSPGSDIPIASATEAIVLAVYMPPQAPSPGQIARSIASTSSRDIRPAAQAPTASNASMIVTVLLGAVGELGDAGEDRARVEEDGREVEARGGHEHPRERLVAAGEQHRAVEALGVHHGLDGVGDDLAAHEREVHSLVAHGDAVGHRDRAELERVATARVHAVLDGLGKPVEGRVAGRDLVPRAGDTDLRLGEVVVAEPHRPQSIPRAAVFSRPSVTSRLRGLMSGRLRHGPQHRTVSAGWTRHLHPGGRPAEPRPCRGTDSQPSPGRGQPASEPVQPPTSRIAHSPRDEALSSRSRPRGRLCDLPRAIAQQARQLGHRGGCARPRARGSISPASSRMVSSTCL